MALCRCSSLYQRSHVVTQRRAWRKSANGLSGNCGRYFKVLNSDSEYGWSFDSVDVIVRGVERHDWATGGQFWSDKAVPAPRP